MLVSLIAKPTEPDLIKSVDELVRQDEILWLIEAGSAFTNFGMDAEEGTTLKYTLQSNDGNAHDITILFLGFTMMRQLSYQELAMVKTTLSA